MANVLNRTTKEYRVSVNTPDFPPAQWIINPDVSLVAGNPTKYWKITGDIVTLMNAAEQQAVDDAETAALLADAQADATALPDDPLSVDVRALILNANKRTNWLTNRVEELQAAIVAIEQSQGGTGNMRDAIRTVLPFSATSTRTLPAAIQGYKDDIAAGEAN